MTPADYRTALATLGLSQLAAGRWLGVSNKTAQRYATTGPSGAAARAVGMAVALRGLERFSDHMTRPGCAMPCPTSPLVRNADVMAALGLPAK